MLLLPARSGILTRPFRNRTTYPARPLIRSLSNRPTSLTRTAHAKINLGLEVLRRRSDGYHDLATVFCPIALSDEISCELTDEGVDLVVAGIQAPPDETNLCARAAQILLPYATERVGARIRLTKRIPIGAGLGGGSSDAACTLRMLNTMWNTALPDEELLRLSTTLGADVSYFMMGGLAFGTGTGTTLAPLGTGIPYWIVVVVPPEHVSTSWAYGQVRPRNTDSSSLRASFERSLGDLKSLDQALTNDFEHAVLPAYPAIRETMTELTESGLSCVRMSGSGSAVFGLTSEQKAAEEAASKFSAPFIVSVTPPVQS